MRHLLPIVFATFALTLTNLPADDAAAPASPTPAPAPAAAAKPAPPVTMPTKPQTGSFFDLKANSLNGQPVDLSQYKGKTVLVVNVASKCGFTPEYAALEKLYTDNADKGLVVLGFPSNDFKQEPGSATDIAAFCTSKYNVTFPLFEKVGVKNGPDQSPVYQYLTSVGVSAPTWNFCKYLIDKNGKVLEFYPSQPLKGWPETTTPATQKFLDDLNAALKS